MQAVGPRSFDGIDIAIFSAGAARSRDWAPHAVAAGAVVVDNSSAFRMDPGVPLVVPEVNPQAARGHAGLIANPNCSTMQLVPVLAALHRRSPLEHVTVATYQSVSGTGQKAIDGLRARVGSRARGRGAGAPPCTRTPSPSTRCRSPGSLPGDDGYTDEELKLVNESRKILDLPDLRVSATCVRVPVVNAHSEAVWVRTREPLAPDEARELLAPRPASPSSTTRRPTRYPDGARRRRHRRRARRAASAATSATNALALWIVADNLRKGAATNAVEIAELLVRDSLLRSAA